MFFFIFFSFFLKKPFRLELKPGVSTPYKIQDASVREHKPTVLHSRFFFDQFSMQIRVGHCSGVKIAEYQFIGPLQSALLNCPTVIPIGFYFPSYRQLCRFGSWKHFVVLKRILFELTIDQLKKFLFFFLQNQSSRYFHQLLQVRYRFLLLASARRI